MNFVNVHEIFKMKVVLLLFLFLAVANAGKILFFMPLMPKSTTMTFMPIAEEMARRGHQVTVVNAFGTKTQLPTLTQIKLDFNAVDVLDFSSQMLADNATILGLTTTMFEGVGKMMSSWDLIFDELKSKHDFFNGQQFDITLVYGFLTNEVGYFVSRKFNSTLVLYSALQSSSITTDWAMGQPHNPAVLPSVGFQFRHPMSFKERVLNTLATMMFYAARNYLQLPYQERFLARHFPEDEIPSLLELETNAGLTLAFGNPLLQDGLRPVSPNYVMIGMMNCRQGQPLPNQLQTFMDEAEHGVIFVSFGSVLKANQMADSLRLKLLTVFKNVKQRVIWKWETETMEGKPDNVFLGKWLPQQDILAHPKLKLFITHGGQSSSQEALCHQKPIVAIPVFGDQPANAFEAQHRGYGIMIPLPDLTSQNLLEAVNTILEDETYSQRAQTYGAMVMDQMTTPMQRATWWLEYTLKYPGMKQMRSPVHDLHWIQYFLLDVIFFVILTAILISALFVFICKCCCLRKCCKSSLKNKRD